MSPPSIAGAGAAWPPSQPQVGAAAAQPPLQPQADLQHFGLQQRLLQTKMRSRSEPQQRDLQQLLPQLFPQAGAAAQVGSATAQVGSAAAQVGAAAPQQPLPPQAEPHLGLQQRLKLKSGWRQHFCLQHPAARSQPHEGAAAQVGSAAAQVGPAAAQVGSAAAQQLGAAASQQLFFAQPDSQQLLTPSMRSNSSKPKLWVQIPKPNTSDPIRVFHFIEPRLLSLSTVQLALPVPAKCGFYCGGCRAERIRRSVGFAVRCFAKPDTTNCSIW